jgi:hypothetical protein
LFRQQSTNKPDTAAVAVPAASDKSTMAAMPAPPVAQHQPGGRSCRERGRTPGSWLW